MKTIELFKKQKEEKSKSDKIKKILHESLPILKEKFIQNLLSGSSSITENGAIERLKTLAPEILSVSYCIAVIVPDIHKISPKSIDFMLVTTQNIVNKLLSDAKFKVFSYYDSLYRLIIVIGSEQNIYLNNIESVISSVRDKLRFYYELDIYAGIGYTTDSISSLYCSFESAIEAMNYMGVFGQNNVVSINNVIQIDNLDTTQNMDALKSAINSYKTGEIDIVLAELDKYVKTLIATSLGNVEMIKKIYLEYVSAAFRYCFNQGITIEGINEADVFYKIFTLNNFVHLKQYVTEICTIIVNTINLKRKSKKNLIIENAKKFINDNIRNENLDLKMVSEQLGLSSIYFSQLFHKEQNIRFNDYLNNVRVKKAKELLKTTNLKVYEIAYEVGYKNSKYFYYIFKKYSGLTPSDYRNI
jgi:two-component system response regulator YesN